MLKSLIIDNYALIEHSDIKFESGFTVITGETGAGKSIMLGALALLLGQRAEASVLKNPDKNVWWRQLLKLLIILCVRSLRKTDWTMMKSAWCVAKLRHRASQGIHQRYTRHGDIAQGIGRPPDRHPFAAPESVAEQSRFSTGSGGYHSCQSAATGPIMGQTMPSISQIGQHSPICVRRRPAVRQTGNLLSSSINSWLMPTWCQTNCRIWKMSS